MDCPVKKNLHYTMSVEDMGSAGEGICKIDGFTVFVEGGVTGDILEVRIVKVKKDFAYGKIINIITPSKERSSEPECKYFPHCGGCQLLNMTYDAQLNFKTKRVKDCIERIGGFKDFNVIPAIGMDYPKYFRNKAQFPVGIKGGVPAVGFYAKRSHNIVDIDVCPIHHKAASEVAGIFRDFLTDYDIPIYDETTHKGIVRHILVRVAFATGEVMVIVVANGKKLPKARILAERLKIIDGMTSIFINTNTQKGNVILGKKNRLIWGKEYITDYIGNVKFEISPLSFYQVNPVQTKKLYEKAVELAGITVNENVLDIYCGIGTISLFMAEKAKSVLGVEVIEQAIKNAQRNAEINGIKNARFELGKAEDIIPKIYSEGYRADVVVVDPPRKGCDKEVIDTIINMLPEKVVYISCEPSTLARDLKLFAQNGYSFKDVWCYDQFCGSVHVESVVLITRAVESKQ